MSRRGEPIHHRHFQVHEDDVGSQFRRQIDDLPPVGGVSNNHQPRIGVQCEPKSQAKARVVVSISSLTRSCFSRV